MGKGSYFCQLSKKVKTLKLETPGTDLLLLMLMRLKGSPKVQAPEALLL